MYRLFAKCGGTAAIQANLDRSFLSALKLSDQQTCITVSLQKCYSKSKQKSPHKKEKRVDSVDIFENIRTLNVDRVIRNKKPSNPIISMALDEPPRRERSKLYSVEYPTGPDLKGRLYEDHEEREYRLVYRGRGGAWLMKFLLHRTLINRNERLPTLIRYLVE